VGEPSDELERVYRELGARLWRAVLAFTGDREVANDAVAEAFAQALRRADSLRSAERWVWRAAFRIAAGELKDRRTREPLGAGGSYKMPDPRIDLLDALAELSPRQRAALLLHDYAGYSASEAGAILGSTASTVRVHLTRARRRLRRLLDDDDA
jgi:RNA polymerase sigma-70 factor (ECF subfamily)